MRVHDKLGPCIHTYVQRFKKKKLALFNGSDYYRCIIPFVCYDARNVRLLFLIVRNNHEMIFIENVICLLGSYQRMFMFIYD